MKMLLSEQIAELIERMLDEGDGSANVQRNDLAEALGCVPSQVSYVISSRFTPERGYITESRRGGGGYIRIVRAAMTKDQYLTHFFYALGDSVTENEARAYLRNLRDNGVITEREAVIVSNAISSAALDRIRPAAGKNMVRADIMRRILMSLMN